MKVEELDDTELKEGASVKCQQDKDKEWEEREVRIHCQTKKNLFFVMERDWLLYFIFLQLHPTRDLDIYPMVGSRKNFQ